MLLYAPSPSLSLLSFSLLTVEEFLSSLCSLFPWDRWRRSSSGRGERGRSGSWRRTSPPPFRRRPRCRRRKRGTRGGRRMEGRRAGTRSVAIGPRRPSPARSGPKSRSLSGASPGASSIAPPRSAPPTSSPSWLRMVRRTLSSFQSVCSSVDVVPVAVCFRVFISYWCLMLIDLFADPFCRGGCECDCGRRGGARPCKASGGAAASAGKGRECRRRRSPLRTWGWKRERFCSRTSCSEGIHLGTFLYFFMWTRNLEALMILVETNYEDGTRILFLTAI